MRIGPIETEAEAERARQQRDQFLAGADYVRNTVAPFDVDPEIWAAQAEACEAIAEEFGEALAEFAKRAPIP